MKFVPTVCISIYLDTIYCSTFFFLTHDTHPEAATALADLLTRCFISSRRR